jgi:uncharacterized 2Fe-2S/4Fe-4S cluster protein (DUF4445 family)
LPLSLSDIAVIVDLGTTTLAAALIDGSSGAELAAAGILNPQRSEGLDVVSRLAVAATPDGLARLRDQVNRALESLVLELCQGAGVAPGRISRVVIAGNTVMQHLLLGAPTDTLSRPPFRPRQTGSCIVGSSSLGWQFDLPLHLFPQPGGFVGGDLVAFLYSQGVLGTEIAERGEGSRQGNHEGFHDPRPANLEPRTCLYLDLGTNAEIALLTGERLLATSAAAGPAFEAGNLSCGMLAQPGAISRLTLVDERPQLSVVGNTSPLGLCGSGAISAIAALRQAGVISPSGQLLPAVEVPSNLANYLLGSGKDAAFALYRDARRTIVLTQEDVRQVQLAIAAVRAGIEVLLARAGIAAADLTEVVITGSFGAALAPADLETIGLLPPGGATASRFVANGVLRGAGRAVITPDGLAAVDRVAERLQVIPLSGTPLFEKLFIDHLTFP